MRARDNPFATAHLHRLRYRLRGWSWEEFMRRLAQMNFRAAIVGPEGSGKTTLLENLAPRLQAEGFEVVPLRLTRENNGFSREALDRMFAALTLRHMLLFDGAEQMPRWAWLRFRWNARRAGGLVVTAHRSGLLPTLHECGTSADLLAELIAELSGGTPSALPKQAAELMAKHRGNLRDALRDLYDQWAERTEHAVLSS